jgi:hypothetical protein
VNVAESTTTQGSVGTPTTNFAASSKWATEGEQVRDFRSNLAKQIASGASVPPTDSFGPYLSQPVDVTRDGDYDIVIGPLNSADADAPFVPGIHVPGDVGFTNYVDHTLHTYTASDGKVYGKFTLVVSDFKAEYDGLTIWAD